MGLDGVELIMATEDKFGISIPDDEASLIRTPNDLYHSIARKLDISDANTCDTQKAFYLLRSAMRRNYNIPRKRFRPDSPLDGLLPVEQRRAEWLRLRDSLGATSWPELGFPIPARVVGAIASFTAWAILSYVSYRVMGVRMYLGVVGSFVLILWAAIKSATIFASYQTSLAGMTAGTLSEFLVAENPQLFPQVNPAWSMERIRLVTRQIIIDQIGVPQDFDDNASFIDDLGVD